MVRKNIKDLLVYGTIYSASFGIGCIRGAAIAGTGDFSTWKQDKTTTLDGILFMALPVAGGISSLVYEVINDESLLNIDAFYSRQHLAEIGSNTTCQLIGSLVTGIKVSVYYNLGMLAGYVCTKLTN